MTLQKHYYTYTLVDLVTKEPVGWNSVVAGTEEQAIEQALIYFDSNWDENTDYIIDESSFVKQTDDEMEKLMWYTA